MYTLLLDINHAVDEAGESLDSESALEWRLKYRDILLAADQECPPPIAPEGHKGRLKRSKARNLLERIRKFEYDTLRFMEVKEVPFTNNQAERDLCMVKVHQKVSGCFRSMDTA